MPWDEINEAALQQIGYSLFELKAAGGKAFECPAVLQATRPSEQPRSTDFLCAKRNDKPVQTLTSCEKVSEKKDEGHITIKMDSVFFKTGSKAEHGALFTAGCQRMAADQAESPLPTNGEQSLTKDVCVSRRRNHQRYGQLTTERRSEELDRTSLSNLSKNILILINEKPGEQPRFMICFS